MTANSTPESFDAVLAEVYALPKASQCKALADRLQSAHARELAEQQATHAAEVGELDIERARQAGRVFEERARAEAAEARVDAAMGLVANWREEASHMDYGPGYRENMEDCADELEQALAGGERNDG